MELKHFNFIMKQEPINMKNTRTHHVITPEVQTNSFLGLLQMSGFFLTT